MVICTLNKGLPLKQTVIRGQVFYMIERNQIACVLDYIFTFRLNNNGHYCNYMRETVQNMPGMPVSCCIKLCFSFCIRSKISTCPFIFRVCSWIFFYFRQTTSLNYVLTVHICTQNIQKVSNKCLQVRPFKRSAKYRRIVCNLQAQDFSTESQDQAFPVGAVLEAGII